MRILQLNNRVNRNNIFHFGREHGENLYYKNNPSGYWTNYRHLILYFKLELFY